MFIERMKKNVGSYHGGNSYYVVYRVQSNSVRSANQIVRDREISSALVENLPTTYAQHATFNRVFLMSESQATIL